ncbi:inositol-1-monophosphatase [Orbaceae bacterium ESL0727]|nr:inositol-1-monophosphatase [Orbaceae bacterium ESL0727]
MQPLLNIAIRAARKAGNVAIKAYENPVSIEIDSKGDNSVVTNIDRAAEALIVETIKKAYPDHTIVAEESGIIKGKESEIQWIIDPIDGTTNFIKNIPHFAVSIAVRVKGKTEAAVVYNPITNELYTASRGHGAQLNGYRLRVNNSKDLASSMLATIFPAHNKQYSDCYFAVLQKLFTQCSHFRYTGSAALDLAFTAAGRLDGLFELGLKPWDIVAGELILREAGGVITDFAGNNNYMTSGNVIAGHPKVVKDLLVMTQDLWDERLKV